MEIIRILRKFFLILFAYSAYCNSPVCIFNPPEGWECADPSVLSEHVQIGFIGKGKNPFRPSLNLATEDVTISLREYIKAVKEIYKEDRNTKWRNIGTLKTKAGQAHLAELTAMTQWGEVKMLQAIVVKDNRAFILTGAVHKEEYRNYHKELLRAFRSMDVSSDLYSFVSNKEKQETLVHSIHSLKDRLHSFKLDKQTPEQKKELEYFQKMILNDYKDMGVHWQILIIKDTYEQLMNP